MENDMQSFSSWHWIILILILVLNAIPISKILGRVGLSKWWSEDRQLIQHALTKGQD